MKLPINISFEDILALPWEANGFTLVIAPPSFLARQGGFELFFTVKDDIWRGGTYLQTSEMGNCPIFNKFEQLYCKNSGVGETLYLLKKLGLNITISQYSTITPDIWEDFERETKGKSDKVKRSWMYQRTHKKKLIAQDSFGNYWPSHWLQLYYLDGKSIKVVEKDPSWYRVGSYDYYTMKDVYNIDGEDVPLLAIIDFYEECHICGYIHSKEECPNCSIFYKVNEYNFKVESILEFKNDGEKDPLYLGIELEYEDVRGQEKEFAQALNGHALLKRDGSISYGFEITTCPATLAVHKKAFESFFDKVKPKIKDNCGMHVHVDKKKLGEMQIGKLLAFLNKEENAVQIRKIAGRDYVNNHYCAANKEVNVTFGIVGDDYEVRRRAVGKYAALNTSKGPTIEFRIFAPPKDKNELYMRMEFVQALVDFTKPAIVSVKDAVKWEKFTEFVRQYKKFYPDLYSFIMEIA